MTPQRRHVHFVLPGKPVGWQVARYNPRSGKHYKPKTLVAFELLVASEFVEAARDQAPGVQFADWRGRVYLTIKVYHSIPRSWPKEIRDLATQNKLSCSQKPDFTNVAKAVEDGLTGVAYTDDCQVVPGPGCDKVFAAEPHTEVWVEYSGENPAIGAGRIHDIWEPTYLASLRHCEVERDTTSPTAPPCLSPYGGATALPPRGRTHASTRGISTPAALRGTAERSGGGQATGRRTALGAHRTSGAGAQGLCSGT